MAPSAPFSRTATGTRISACACVPNPITERISAACSTRTHRRAFDLIDDIGGGLNWPTLRFPLRVESARDILAALLAPTPAQKDALQGNDSWVSEAKALFEAALGLKLMTRSKAWSSVADELWRYLLFSEFRFDLPGTLPPALGNVPHAPEFARPTVDGLCDGLRNDAAPPAGLYRSCRGYREGTEPSRCLRRHRRSGDCRDTFPFEERTFLSQAIRALKEDRLDDIRETIRRHSGSVWIGKGESQAQWNLLKAALALVEGCEDAVRQLPDHTHRLDPLIDFYVATLRHVDQLQREFEQAVGDYIGLDGALPEVVELARGRYGSWRARSSRSSSSIWK